MAGIYGLLRFDGAPIDPRERSAMQDAMSFCGDDSQYLDIGKSVVLGRVARTTIPAAVFGWQPSLLGNGCALVASGRIDNRAELARLLSVPHAERATLPDSGLIERAYLEWGEACAGRIYGDWAFAVWDPREHKLFLARDHHGNTSMYYTANDRYFAFASSRKALLALDARVGHAIDDLYIAQVMLSWPVYHGERTVHTAIRRLPPAHSLTAASGTVRTHRYWCLEDVQQLPSCSLEEAVEGFLPVFETAVHDRIRNADSIATTLSGGLDSGSVTVIAAKLLQTAGRSLIAYTSVPVSDNAVHNEQRFGDEWELANQTAALNRNVDHRRIAATTLTPLEALRMSLWAHDEPQHAAGNAFWIMDLMRTAGADGCNVLLTGQGGNAGISWTGDPPDRHRFRPVTMRERAKRLAHAVLPDRLELKMHASWLQWRAPWVRSLAIHPDLMERTHAVRLSIYDPEHPSHPRHAGSRARRLSLIKPGRSIIGCLHAENSAAHGIEVLDPTSDVRVLSYCLSLPENILFDPVAKMDRMLIRAAMKERLPESVRLNRKRGLQAADLPYRLRADRPAMESCLDELQRGRASDYLNMKRLRQAWSIVLERDDQEAYREASTVLLRGIMVGLFVNQPAMSSRPLSVGTTSAAVIC